MKLVLTAMLAALLLGATGTAFGYPALIGPTGLAATPTANSASSGSLLVAGTFYNTEDSDLAMDNSLAARAVFGLLLSLEVGAAFWRAGIDGADVDTASANAKIALPISLIGGKTALGAVLASTNPPIGPDVTTTYIYVANTRSLLGIPGGAQVFSLTLGANWTQFEDGASVDDIRGFAGFEFAILDRLSLAAEYQSESGDLGDADPLTSVVGRMVLNDNFYLEAGVTNADPLSGCFTATSEHNLFASLIYGWGKK